MIDYSAFYIEYFNNLKIIENYYNLKFNEIEFDTINQESFDLIYQLVLIIKNGELKYNWDEIVEATMFENSTDAFKELEKMHTDKILVVINEKGEETIEIHNQKIILGFKQVKIEEPFVFNLEEIKTGKEEIVKIKSNTKKIIVSYFQSPQEQTLI
jgi:hypothetical protein